MQQTWDSGSIPGSGAHPGGGHDDPLQYFCLHDPMDRGTWQAILHRVAKSLRQLSMLAHRQWWFGCWELYNTFLIKNAKKIKNKNKKQQRQISPENGELCNFLQSHVERWKKVAWYFKEKGKSCPRCFFPFHQKEKKKKKNNKRKIKRS